MTRSNRAIIFSIFVGIIVVVLLSLMIGCITCIVIVQIIFVILLSVVFCYRSYAAMLEEDDVKQNKNGELDSLIKPDEKVDSVKIPVFEIGENNDIWEERRD